MKDVRDLLWQSVIFVGYGDDRLLYEQRQKSDRGIFVRVSHAFQRYAATAA